MAKPEPSMDQWLAEAKQDPKAAQCGMFLTHNGVVRITPKAQVREGVEGLGDVAQVDFSYDAEGLEQAVKEALTWPGVYYVHVWLNEGALNVGDSLMYVLIGADIRPRCIDALQNLVGKIKNDLVVEKEIYAEARHPGINENRAAGSNEPAALFIDERNRRSVPRYSRERLR